MKYAINIGMMSDSDFFSEPFSNHSDIEVKALFFEILNERMK